MKGSKVRTQKLLPYRTLRTGDLVFCREPVQAGSRAFNSMVSGESRLPDNLEIIAGLQIGKHVRAQV